jgi:hypothetical protein
MLISLSEMYSMYVEDFMVRDVRYIWHGMSYGKLKEILKDNRNLKSFPLVDNPGMCTIFVVSLQSEYCWKLCCGKYPLYFYRTLPLVIIPLPFSCSSSYLPTLLLSFVSHFPHFSI